MNCKIIELNPYDAEIKWWSLNFPKVAMLWTLEAALSVREIRTVFPDLLLRGSERLRPVLQVAVCKQEMFLVKMKDIGKLPPQPLYLTQTVTGIYLSLNVGFQS